MATNWIKVQKCHFVSSYPPLLSPLYEDILEVWGLLPKLGQSWPKYTIKWPLHLPLHVYEPLHMYNLLSTKLLLFLRFHACSLRSICIYIGMGLCSKVPEWPRRDKYVCIFLVGNETIFSKQYNFVPHSQDTNKYMYVQWNTCNTIINIVTFKSRPI